MDVDFIEPENLLLQTGYLTIKSYDEIPTGYLYHLTYLNKEVKVLLNRYFCNFLTQPSSETVRQTNELYKAIKKAEISKLYDILKTLFESIPYEWHRKNEIANYEGYYSSVVYSFFAGAGFEMIAENYTSKGRIDLSLFYEKKCFMIEFKVVE